MVLTERQIELIRDSHGWLMPEAQRLSGVFYDDLFRRAPNLRALFREDLAEQGMKFMTAISMITSYLEDRAALEGRLHDLGKAHALFNLRAMDYREMEEALIDTLAEAFKNRFTTEIELAWRSAFSHMAERMLAAKSA
ncbi:MAG: globin domain-containing protein [Pseudomonadota bacterium]